MDQIWEIIGIGLAIIMVIFGLRLLFKKAQPSPPIEQHELIIEPQSMQPIVPRHLRVVNTESLAPSSAIADTPLNASDNAQQKVAEVASVVESATPSNAPSKMETGTVEQVISTDPISTQAAPDQALIDEVPISQDQDLENVSDAIEKNTVAVTDLSAECDDEVNILDAHLSEQSRHDEESALATAQQILALYLYPNPGRALSGERTLKMLLKYGLRFGDMSCFHRYQETDKASPLMFSVLRISEDGTPTGFDLEALPTDEVKGLAFFLALPNPHAVQGFDMMVSLAGLMARDTNGMVFDEQSVELTPQLREHWRHYVIEFKGD